MGAQSCTVNFSDVSRHTNTRPRANDHILRRNANVLDGKNDPTYAQLSRSAPKRSMVVTYDCLCVDQANPTLRLQPIPLC